MQNKRMFIAMAIALGLFAAWQAFIVYTDKTHPDWAKQIEQAATRPAAPAAPAAPAVASGNPAGPATSASTSPVAEPGLRVLGQPASDGAPVRLGSITPNDAVYSMGLTLSAHGAGIDEVILNEFHQSDNRKVLYSFEEPYSNHPGTAPLATQSITINGSTLDLANVAWTPVASDLSSAEYHVDLGDTSGKVARLTKTFHVYPRTSKDNPGDGYEVRVEYAIQNLSDRTLAVKTSLNGPTMPPKEVERGADRQVVGGYKSGPQQITVAQHAIEDFKTSKPDIDMTLNDNEPAVWAGEASVYFNAIVLPAAAAGSAVPGSFSFRAEALDPDSEDKHVAMTIESGTLSIAPGASISLPFDAYFGPKWRKVLETPYYASYPRMYNATLVVASKWCAVCTFQWLISVLVWMLGVFHFVLLHDWGLAIIALVVLVRSLLHPITKRSQVHMMRMGKMGPEMERLKKKYGDDKDALNREMMKLYKTQGLTPILGCLPMFLQMPIWIALWSALQSTFELRQSPFLWFGSVHLTWISDLARPDALYTLTTPLNLGFLQLSSINLLPILLAGVFFLQQKYTPKPPATTPEQEQQQKMMQWMSLLFPVFLYKGPAGLNLYIFTSTAIGIIEGKVIRKHIKEREEAEKAGRVFVETKATRAKRSNREDAAKPKEPKKGLMGWLAELQAKAEQVRAEAERQGGKPKA